MQIIVKNGVQRYKTECIVADQTESIKLILLENNIDKVITGKSFQNKNVTLRIFDDVKYVNRNETTVISAVDDITDVNMSSCHIKDNLLTGQCIGVDVKKTSSCAMCNKPIDVPTTEDTVTCSFCKITLGSSCKDQTGVLTAHPD